MKLTIQNYRNIEKYFNCGSWVVQKVEETHTQYYFECTNYNGKVLDVMLERDPSYGNTKTQFQYEFWCLGRVNPNSQFTKNKEFIYFHQVKDKKLFSSALANMIRKWKNG